MILRASRVAGDLLDVILPQYQSRSTTGRKSLLWSDLGNPLGGWGGKE